MANFCPKCGTRLGPESARGKHQQCMADGCRFFIGNNPGPVNVVLVPVDRGGLPHLLVGLRSKQGDGGFGRYGLPGGWQDRGEDALAGASREVWEEHGLHIDPQSLVLFDFQPGGELTQNVACWIAPTIREEDLPEFVPNEEVGERKLVGPGEELAFSLHTFWADQFFKGKRMIDPRQACRR